MRSIIAATAILLGTATASQAAVYTASYDTYSSASFEKWSVLGDVYQVDVELALSSSQQYSAMSGTHSGPLQVNIAGNFIGSLIISGLPRLDIDGPITPYSVNINLPGNTLFYVSGQVEKTFSFFGDDLDAFVGLGSTGYVGGFAGSTVVPTTDVQGVFFEERRDNKSDWASFRLVYHYTPYPISDIPEPSTWLLMIAGFGLVGGAMRRAHRPAARAA